MSLNIGDALSTGVDKLTTAAGIQLAVVYIALQFLTALGTNSAVAAINPPTGTSGMQAAALSLPIGVAGGAALATLGGILNVALTIVVLRTVVHDAAELSSIPSGVADDMLKTWVFLFIALIVQGIAIGLGFIALIIPGLFLLVSLIFTQVFVAVEDEGPFEALSSSWSMAKGNRFPLFGLGVVLFVISLLVSLPATIVTILSPIVGTVLNYIVTGFVSIFSLSVLVAAYQQLSGPSPAATTETDDDSVERLDDDSGFDYA